MAITFYYASGSPYAWRVWLALEHKQVEYDFKLLTFDRREHKTPEYLALNPRGRVPTIVDEEGFVLYESSAIVEYLEELKPSPPLLPGDARTRALARRIVSEVDGYLYPTGRKLLDVTIFTRDPGPPEKIAELREPVREQVQLLEDMLRGDYLAGALSVADFAAYTTLRLIRRIDERQPGNGIGALPPKLAAWSQRIEALPYFEKTLPPHWKG